ncbi:MAG TPA: DUF72 domain-containing protein [Terriglobales bacterium]|nr:DUF72 domain-containing protein [Terriglobales bacterium]
MSLHVGTSGWAYPAWKPVFYPEKLAQKKFLQYYSTRLNAVEVNYSFRQFIKEATLQNWIAETPEDFKFCVKAHQSITHIRRLKDVDEALTRFLDSIQPLAAAGKLGPALFQLPPNLKCDTVLFDEFCAKLPRNFQAAFEFRHESWLVDEVFRILSKHDVALCFAESDEFQTPIVLTATYSYYRLRRSEYSPQARREIAERLARGLQARRELFAFYKHEERPESALYAEELLKLAQTAAA